MSIETSKQEKQQIIDTDPQMIQNYQIRIWNITKINIFKKKEEKMENFIEKSGFPERVKWKH